ncbi:hypothetical protein J4Q44_G00300040 [Coregonus suidteri]|uniref:Uncharacterized protein n=1 Tax=Coregonus suidteri TaxID=861788 RepID=A0AAN8LA65_9TELE
MLQYLRTLTEDTTELKPQLATSLANQQSNGSCRDMSLPKGIQLPLKDRQDLERRLRRDTDLHEKRVRFLAIKGAEDIRKQCGACYQASSQMTSPWPQPGLG